MESAASEAEQAIAATTAATESAPAPAPAPAASHAPAPATETVAAAAIPDASAEAVPKVAHDAYGLPVQWAVQLGVFTRIEGAQEVKRRAEQAGYHVILQTVAQKGGAQHRVYIGPKLNRNAAASLNREVQQKLGITGYVTRYYP